MMLRLFRRLLAPCTSENQANRVHIALGNRMSPLELAVLTDSARRGELPPHSCAWLRGMEERAALSGKTVPEPFRRRRLGRLGFAYSAGGPTRAKTLALCFTGGGQPRLGMAISLFLQHLTAEECDVLLIMDPEERRVHKGGLPGVARGISGLTAHIGSLYDPAAYRSVVTFGFSRGGLAAVWAALQLRADVGISMCGGSLGNARWQAVGGGPGFRRLAEQTARTPRLLLVHGADNKPDRRNASELAQFVSASCVPLPGEADHNVPFRLLLRRELAAFLAAAFRGEPCWS